MSLLYEYRKSLKMVEVEEFFDLFFYRPLAFILVKIIYPTTITPNQLTITAILFGIAAGCVYAAGTPLALVAGSLLFMGYNIIDCSDGQLARLKKNGTYAGRIIDGIGDYITAIAVFIGLAIGHPDHDFSPNRWYILLVAAAISNMIQSILVDYYRNRFLNYVLERDSTFEEDLDAFKQEYQAIKDQKNKRMDKWIIGAYFKYSALQDKIITKKKGEKLFKADPQEYYKKNKIAIRLLVTIGPTAQVTVLMVCAAISRFDIYFWLILVVFNSIAAILWLVQNNIDKSFTTNVQP